MARESFYECGAKRQSGVKCDEVVSWWDDDSHTFRCSKCGADRGYDGNRKGKPDKRKD